MEKALQAFKAELEAVGGISRQDVKKLVDQRRRELDEAGSSMAAAAAPKRKRGPEPDAGDDARDHKADVKPKAPKRARKEQLSDDEEGDSVDAGAGREKSDAGAAGASFAGRYAPAGSTHACHECRRHSPQMGGTVRCDVDRCGKRFCRGCLEARERPGAAAARGALSAEAKARLRSYDFGALSRGEGKGAGSGAFRCPHCASLCLLKACRQLSREAGGTGAAGKGGRSGSSADSKRGSGSELPLPAAHEDSDTSASDDDAASSASDDSGSSDSRPDSAGRAPSGSRRDKAAAASRSAAAPSRSVRKGKGRGRSESESSGSSSPGGAGDSDSGAGAAKDSRASKGDAGSGRAAHSRQTAGSKQSKGAGKGGSRVGVPAREDADEGDDGLPASLEPAAPAAAAAAVPPAASRGADAGSGSRSVGGPSPVKQRRHPAAVAADGLAEEVVPAPAAAMAGAAAYLREADAAAVSGASLDSAASPSLPNLLHSAGSPSPYPASVGSPAVPAATGASACSGDSAAWSDRLRAATEAFRALAAPGGRLDSLVQLRGSAAAASGSSAGGDGDGFAAALFRPQQRHPLGPLVRLWSLNPYSAATSGDGPTIHVSAPPQLAGAAGAAGVAGGSQALAGARQASISSLLARSGNAGRLSGVDAAEGEGEVDGLYLDGSSARAASDAGRAASSGSGGSSSLSIRLGGAALPVHDPLTGSLFAAAPEVLDAAAEAAAAAAAGSASLPSSASASASAGNVAGSLGVARSASASSLSASTASASASAAAAAAAGRLRHDRASVLHRQTLLSCALQRHPADVSSGVWGETGYMCRVPLPSSVAAALARLAAAERGPSGSSSARRPAPQAAGAAAAGGEAGSEGSRVRPAAAVVGAAASVAGGASVFTLPPPPPLPTKSRSFWGVLPPPAGASLPSPPPPPPPRLASTAAVAAPAPAGSAVAAPAPPPAAVAVANGASGGADALGRGSGSEPPAPLQSGAPWSQHVLPGAALPGASASGGHGLVPPHSGAPYSIVPAAGWPQQLQQQGPPPFASFPHAAFPYGAGPGPGQAGASAAAGGVTAAYGASLGAAMPPYPGYPHAGVGGAPYGPAGSHPGMHPHLQMAMQMQMPQQQRFDGPAGGYPRPPHGFPVPYGPGAAHAMAGYIAGPQPPYPGAGSWPHAQGPPQAPHQRF